jgi:hypothetical protein
MPPTRCPNSGAFSNEEKWVRSPFQAVTQKYVYPRKKRPDLILLIGKSLFSAPPRVFEGLRGEE